MQLALQVFCGMLVRIEQFGDVMADSKLQIKKVIAAHTLACFLIANIVLPRLVALHVPRRT